MSQTLKNNTDFESFIKRFLAGRVNWRAIPRRDNIRNFGNIISLILYREGQYQVELFIVPHQKSSFTRHQHPDVDVVEFGLCGEAMLAVNDVPSCSQEVRDTWLAGLIPTQPVRIQPGEMHSGYGTSPYAFLSIQHWLNGVVPTSVGLNWIGEPSSAEQKALWVDQEAVSHG